MPPTLSGTFPAYADFAPRVPVHCVTPGLTGFIHRYYDSSFSPSGRYMALTRLPFEDRLTKPGDVAEIFVVDLVDGDTRRIADTRGWDVQLGAQLQWGPTTTACISMTSMSAPGNPLECGSIR